MNTELAERFSMAKTKIELLEEDIVATELTDEKLETYRRMLTRARNDYCRNQHCYLTGLSIPAERWKEAVRLIRFGIAHYTDDNLAMGWAWQALGLVYERAGQFGEAYSALIKSTEYGENHDVWGLLRTRIHVDKFRYSERIEDHYRFCAVDHSFVKSLLQNKFYLEIAQIIIARKAENYDEVKEHYHKVMKMLAPEFKGELYEVLKKHRYTESITLSPQCCEFLEGIADYLNEK